MRFRLLFAWNLSLILAGSVGTAVQAALIAPASTTPLAQLIATDPKAAADLEKAVETFRRRDFDQSLKLLKEAHEKHPTLPSGNVMLAQMFMAEGQAGAARAFLERAALEAIGDPMLYVAFGNAALLENRVTDAQLQFEKAQSLLKTSQLSDAEKTRIETDCLEGLTAVGEARTDWKSVQAAITAWLKLDPKNGKARQRLARAVFNQDKPEAALKELEQASKDDPKLPSAAATLGTFYISKSNNEKAEEWLNKAVADNPKDASALATLASWQLNRGRLDEAKANAEVASKIDPQSVQFRGLIGAVLMFQKDFAGAEKIYEELFQKQPGDFAISNQLARALVEQPDSAKQQRALQFAEMNARQFPRNPEALATLGRVYYRLGRLDDSERVLKQVLQSGRATQDAVYFLAYVLADRGQLDEVRKILKTAVDAKGNFVFRKDAEEWLNRMSAKP